MNSIPMIRRERRWSSDSVRRLCIREGYYTKGNVEDYNEMLEMVNDNYPTEKALYVIAFDIFEHSKKDETSINQIMYNLENYSVETLYEVIEEVKDDVEEQ